MSAPTWFSSGPIREDQYTDLSGALAPLLKSGDCIALDGSLGAGKTSFARSLIHRLCDNSDEDIPSPTFTLVQQYEQPDNPDSLVWHFDLYRLERPDDVLELDLDDALDTGISLIEWPEKMGRYLPPDALTIHFEAVEDGTRRQLDFAGHAAWRERLLPALSSWLKQGG